MTRFTFFRDIPRTEIDAFIARGRQLRSEAITRAVSSLFGSNKKKRSARS